jgi:hypothetical protein
MTAEAKQGVRRLFRIGFVCLFALLVFGLIAPFVEIAGLNGRIQRALETSLGRKVDLGEVHLALFSGPGFSIDDVTIQEDPRYGLEPFAHVTTLQARVRLDKLLAGYLRFSSLRLVDPSMNLVKRSDGTWNVVELVQRLSGPRRTPLNLFPVVEVSGARVDFKLGTRKTVLYIADSDLTIYPKRSGKLYIQFSGSPARTDRAGMGFGHFRGTANWYLDPPARNANQLEAELTLDPSNLSELTTLIDGHDAGVHGTVSCRARIDGPSTALHIAGELHLEDVHRWDLLPASGEDWWIRYQGDLDLLAHRLDLETVSPHSAEPAPVAVQMRINDFLTRPVWSISATLNRAPVQNLLPLGRRMGLALPRDLQMKGTLDGVIGYSSNGGLDGFVSIHDAVATLPDIPPFTAELAHAIISPDRIHLDPVVIQTAEHGNLQAGGDYYLSTQKFVTSLNAQQFPIEAVKRTADAWFGAPPALSALKSGIASGQMTFTVPGSNGPPDTTFPASWSGQLQFSDATLNPPGLAFPLKKAEGRIAFDASSLNLSHLSAKLGQQLVSGSYRYNAFAKPPERLHLEMPSMDLAQLEAELSPTLQGQSLFARLRFTHRAIPIWLTSRNLEGDLTVDRFSVNQTNLGPFSTRFTWQGANVQFASVQLNFREGLLRAHGAVNLSAYSPRYRFDAKVTGFPWGGGLLNAEGEFQTSGTDIDALRHLKAAGTFVADGVALSAGDTFSKMSGLFSLSFADDWPNLRLSNIQATQGDDEWNGDAASQSDGKLLFDLEHDGRQFHLVSSLMSENSGSPSSLTDRAVP